MYLPSDACSISGHGPAERPRNGATTSASRASAGSYSGFPDGAILGRKWILSQPAARRPGASQITLAGGDVRGGRAMRKRWRLVGLALLLAGGVLLLRNIAPRHDFMRQDLNRLRLGMTWVEV